MTGLPGWAQLVTAHKHPLYFIVFPLEDALKGGVTMPDLKGHLDSEAGVSTWQEKGTTILVNPGCVMFVPYGCVFFPVPIADGPDKATPARYVFSQTPVFNVVLAKKLPAAVWTAIYNYNFETLSKLQSTTHTPVFDSLKDFAKQVEEHTA